MRPAALLTVVLLAACATSKPAPTMKPIEFLTREGCVQAQTMRGHLDEAIQAFGKPTPYAIVDLDELPATDIRRAYPTPTVLVGSVDMFGMAEPAPPYPAPTWRFYPDGVPSTTQILEKLKSVN